MASGFFHFMCVAVVIHTIPYSHFPLKFVHKFGCISKDLWFIALMTKKKMPYFSRGVISWAYLSAFSLLAKGVKFA